MPSEAVAADTEHENDALDGEAQDRDGQPKKKRRRRRRRGRGKGDGEISQEHDHAEHHDDHGPERDLSEEQLAERSPKFAALGLRSSVLRGVVRAGFTEPTDIQRDMIPLALAGRDILGQAKTGTGKTAAFALPILHMADKGVPGQALILAPTRELAQQITTEINDLGRFTPLRALTIYGGQRIGDQVKKLERKPEIIVGTPGRIIDMVNRGLLSYANVRYAVLDEVDRMLDIGFRDDIRRILKACPRERQTVFVSATLSDEIERLARSYMNEPEKIKTTQGALTVAMVQQYYFAVQPWDKKRLLAHLLTHEDPALTLVFCRLKRTCDDLVRYLERKDINAHAIHGDMRQGKRNTVMTQFRSGKLEVLIASDLASRGIDVDGISHVINYDLPEDPDLYVHRIGRTARAGRDGVAWSLVTPEQGKLLTQIELLINAEIPKKDYPDFQDSERPEGFRDPSGAPSIPTPTGPPPENRMKGPELPATAEADPSKFPGGIVPTKMPPKVIRGKVRTRR